MISMTLDDQLNAYERRLIREALRKTCGNRTLAAKLLGIKRRNLYQRMARLGIMSTSETKGADCVNSDTLPFQDSSGNDDDIL